MVTGMKIDNPKENLECIPCIMGKHKRGSFKNKPTHRATKIGQTIHMDTCGPVTPETNRGHKYYLSITDEYSHYTWIYFMHTKDQAINIFKDHMQLIFNHTGKYPENLRSDNEFYIHREFNQTCNTLGIQQQATNTYTPQQNGVAERQNLTIMNSVRTILIASGLPKTLWAEAANIIVYTRNRSPSKATGNK
jgi:transposase InsO family protein